MKKGTKVIYNNTLYIIWEKHKNFVKIYNPVTALPELTIIATSINNVKKA